MGRIWSGAQFMGTLGQHPCSRVHSKLLLGTSRSSSSYQSYSIHFNSIPFHSLSPPVVPRCYSLEGRVDVREHPLTDNRPPFEVSQSMDLCHDDGIITGHNRLHIKVSQSAHLCCDNIVTSHKSPHIETSLSEAPSKNRPPFKAS
jgi:hypothetical protein